jgi:hypothetical protein
MTGELKYWSAGAGGTMLGRRSGSATGELKLQDGRVTGKASQPNEMDTMFPNGFDGHFDENGEIFGCQVGSWRASKAGL